MAQRMAARVLKPIERYLHVEASSGVILLVVAVIAFVLANSPWAAWFEHLWHTPIVVGVGPFVSRQTLHFWINDGLMTIFFFVVGLEIRREIHEGELSDLKRAALPVAAALGGMIAPALLYAALNTGPSLHGWGVPMATDIAFAVGVLALLGKRVPPALRVLLLALAIIDDIGAILVIALFYSSGVSWSGLLIAAAGVLGIVVFQRFAIRRALAYVVPAAVVWLGMLRAGVHPTIAGVIVGLLTPVRPWFGREGFLSAVGSAMDDVRDGEAHEGMLEPLHRIKQAQREALSPLVRNQTRLHPWVAYGVMPLFALANAGVSLSGLSLGEGESTRVIFGVLLGLVVGKPLGIVLASYATVRLGLAALPRGVDWFGVLLVGAVGGIGFTMAIFIAGLAFDDAVMLGAAKLSVLVSSLLAGVGGLIIGRLVLPEKPVPGAALTVEEAEASTEQ